ncbi:hypothetical protein DACRYDRAFT_108671 [Dacryopinax primogenitus]|uniref:MARVEL domain-containing protein n=1 Tax=Dacryopinax primogenitus (strain DJM 731) TaxID=1858805 RepID=M5FXU6_DACPD|nr:uncharacterized protein DACRYDRAFT_108671 [Dacryopinax primogenitus]EJU00605.1 hypothetical protein DACRYDRAFT_108671 [Dacryopinax primogenitus]
MAVLGPALYRTIFYLLALLASIAELGVSAALLSLENEDLGAGEAFAQFVVSLVCLFLVLLGEVFVRLRFLASTSFELGVVGLLWVMWLASAAWTTSEVSSTFGVGNCDESSSQIVNWTIEMTLSDAEAMCREWKAVEALAWINWVFGSLNRPFL